MARRGSNIVPIHPAVAAARQRVASHTTIELDEAPLPSAYRQLRMVTRRGMLLSVVPLAVLVAGMSILPIPGAVITSGYLTAESAPKLIQSAEGGVVEEILVAEGEMVTAGDPLMVLDATAARAEVAIAAKARDQLAARNARLEAEVRGQAEIIFPAELLLRHVEPEVASILAAERALFTLRRDTHQRQLDQMREQAVQIDEQVKGVEGQLAAVARQHEILSEELVGLRQLLAEQLVNVSRVSEAEQNLSIVEGQRAELNATIALARARRAELGSEMAELEASRMSKAAEEQREVQAELSELDEKLVAARRRLEQTTLAAPVAGTVTDLRVRTVGGVVTPSDTVMTIIPAEDRLIAEVKLSPRDIANVHLGQGAELHFTAIGGAAAPQFSGAVIYVAPDIVVDPRTGAGHFVTRVEMQEPLNAAAREMEPPSAGTPVEVFLLTEARTVLEYIAKPILDQARRAFR